MGAKIIRLRYAGTCRECGLALPASTKAWWNPGERSTTCLDCVQVEVAEPPRTQVAAAGEAAPLSSSPKPSYAGQAGASARQEYEKRHQRREAKIDQRWGRLAGVVKFLSDDPQSTRAWARGSEGERRLAESLTRRVGERAVLLHDCKVPKTRGNIDHIAIAASGVWVIDAKTYKGLVERRDKGGWFTTDYRLYVNGRDRTKLAEGLAWQVRAVRTALAGPDVPIHAAVCFIDAEWKHFAKPFRLRDAWITWGLKLAEMIAADGPLTEAEVMQLADRLATALPPMVPAL
ncbi:MAG: nuclease-related domain-containing protein [Acidimicrobiales bacterium]